MATTPRFALRYSGLNEAPNAEQLGQFLATDVESWLSRAFPCLSSARPTGVSQGFLIFETDTGLVQIWNGSAWAQVGTGGGGGGGGGFVGVEGQWKASGNQNIPDGADTVVAFGTTETTSGVVTRATSGSGHKFVLAESGTYAITAVVRFQSGTAASRFIELRDAAQSTGYVSAGDTGGPGAVTRHFSLTKRFSAAQELIVIAAQSSGATLATDAVGSVPPVPRVRLTIVKIAS